MCCLLDDSVANASATLVYVTSNERWLPVPGYPGYEVSDHGRVRSLDRKAPSRWGTPQTLTGRVLSQALVGGSGPNGRYRGCVLYRDGKPTRKTVHVLVLETFVGPRPAGMNGCHRDDDPTNNRLDNLCWGTQRQNVRDAIASGRHVSVAQAAKTHCPQGHEYTPENTYVFAKTNHRLCRACGKTRNKGNANHTRTHCPQGHAYDEANTYRDGSNRRHCRACKRNRMRKYSRDKRSNRN